MAYDTTYVSVIGLRLIKVWEKVTALSGVAACRCPPSQATPKPTMVTSFTTFCTIGVRVEVAVITAVSAIPLAVAGTEMVTVTETGLANAQRDANRLKYCTPILGLERAERITVSVTLPLCRGVWV